MGKMFDEMRKRAAKDAKAPVTLPEGVYHFRIKSGKLVEQDRKNDKGPFAKALYALQVVDAVEVPATDLEGITQEQLQSAMVSYEIPLFRVDDEYRLPNFATKLGIDIEPLTIPETVTETKGYEIVGEVYHVETQKGPFAKVRNVGPVED